MFTGCRLHFKISLIRFAVAYERTTKGGLMKFPRTVINRYTVVPDRRKHIFNVLSIKLHFKREQRRFSTVHLDLFNDFFFGKSKNVCVCAPERDRHRGKAYREKEKTIEKKPMVTACNYVNLHISAAMSTPTTIEFDSLLQPQKNIK